MKKLAKLLAVAVVGASMFGGVAAAQNNCTISNTGQGSINTCTNQTITTVVVTCTNGFNTTNNNIQNAITGGATVNGNTISGNATTGNAQNINDVETTLAAFCAAAPTTPPTPTPTPPTVVAEAPTPVAPAPVAALPKTGVLSGIQTAFAAVAATAVIAGLSQVAVSAYRRSVN